MKLLKSAPVSLTDFPLRLKVLSFLVLECVIAFRINLHVSSECGPGDPPRHLIILLFVWLVSTFVNISGRSVFNWRYDQIR
jgi:hypothetical protein